MADHFFELHGDPEEGYWYLDDPVDQNGVEVEDAWRLRTGKPAELTGPLRIPFMEPGKPRDVSMAGLSQIPVIHIKLANVLLEHAADEVQLIPVTIPSHPDQYVILVTPRVIRCIDEQASEGVRFWEPRHGQPWRVGEYRSVDILRIDKSKVGDAKIFRPWGWNGSLIVSEDLKTALERTGATGMHFTEV
ncbi:imm11 family protein [Corallococcus interemptor]|uniref:imm11 family protein n=1 Tax=Corallococcus interemptor TaxID=2316720 RepID=UPI003D07CCDD